MLVNLSDDKSRDVEIDGVDGSVESGDVEYGDCVAGWDRCRNLPWESLMCRDVVCNSRSGLLFSGLVAASV